LRQEKDCTVQQVRDGIAQSRLLQRFAHIAHGSFSNLPKSKLGLITLPRMGDLHELPQQIFRAGDLETPPREQPLRNP
jgi:hypothetical protein